MPPSPSVCVCVCVCVACCVGVCVKERTLTRIKARHQAQPVCVFCLYACCLRTDSNPSKRLNALWHLFWCTLQDGVCAMSCSVFQCIAGLQCMFQMKTRMGLASKSVLPKLQRLFWKRTLFNFLRALLPKRCSNLGSRLIVATQRPTGCFIFARLLSQHTATDRKAPQHTYTLQHTARPLGCLIAACLFPV